LKDLHNDSIASNKSQVSEHEEEDANLSLHGEITNPCFDLDFSAEGDHDESMTCDFVVEIEEC